MESNQSNATVCLVRDLVLGGIATRKAWNSMMERTAGGKLYHCKQDMGLNVVP